jgi:hypothetical protein
LVSGPLWGQWPDFNFLCFTITCFLLHVERPLWREDGSIICSAMTHWLESLGTHNHTLLSHLRLPQPGGPGPHFRHLLRLSGLRWRYSNPPPHAVGMCR